MTATTTATPTTDPTPTATADLPVAEPTDEARPLLGWAVHDAIAIAGRNLRGMTRQPQLMVFATIQPIIFVLMFRYVFGGAIKIPGVRYVDFLMAGVFVQTITFGAMQTAVGLAEDLHSGLIERFRSLPMARSAVLAGRTLADLVRNLAVVLLMVAVGYAVGFRMHTNIAAFTLGLLVLLAFAFALSWMFAFIGLSAPNAEAAQAMSFPIIAPLVFASSAFVAVSTMPGWLQSFASRQPVTVTANAVRALSIGGPSLTPALQSLAWSAGFVAIFAPLAVRRYRRAA